MSEYRRLARPSGVIRHPEDVGRMRRILNERGYDAACGDIQWAFEEYSEDEWAAGWMTPGWFADEKLARILLARLVESDPPGGGP